MNRANFHMCPELTLKDLKDTARSMAQQYFDNEQSAVFGKLSKELNRLSEIYEKILCGEIIHKKIDKRIVKKHIIYQPRPDFYGARYYSLCMRVCT